MTHLKQLSLFITEYCNLRCDYCFSPRFGKKCIDFEIAQRAIDCLFRNSGDESSLRVSFWGGEPLSSFDLLKRIVQYCMEMKDQCKKKIQFSIPTNATLLNEHILDFLQEHQIALSLSIDGTQQSQAVRKTANGKSSFPLVERSLAFIKKRLMDPPLSIRKTVAPWAVQNLYADIDFFIGQSFSLISFSPVMEERWTVHDYEVYRNELFRVADRWIEELRKGSNISIRLWDELFLVKRLQKIKAFSKKLLYYCGVGDCMIACDVNGTFYPCHRFVFYDRETKAKCLGNTENGLTETKVFESFQKIEEKAILKKNYKCSICRYSDICLVFCPAINYRLTGNILKIDDRLCRYMFIAGETLHYIERKIGEEKCFKDYIRNSVLKRYLNDPGSKYFSLFWDKVQNEDKDALVMKAESLLKRTCEEKQRYEK